MEKLNESILVDEKITGLIEVTVIMEEPSIAADIANYIAQFIKDFVAAEQRKEATTKQRQRRRFAKANVRRELRRVLGHHGFNRQWAFARK